MFWCSSCFLSISFCSEKFLLNSAYSSHDEWQPTCRFSQLKHGIFSTLLILRTRFHNVTCLISRLSAASIHKQNCFFGYPPVNRLEQNFPCIFVTFWPRTIAQRFFATPAYRLFFSEACLYFVLIPFHFYSSHGLKNRCPPISVTNCWLSCHSLSHHFGA